MNFIFPLLTFVGLVLNKEPDIEKKPTPLTIPMQQAIHILVVGGAGADVEEQDISKFT